MSRNTVRIWPQTRSGIRGWSPFQFTEYSPPMANSNRSPARLRDIATTVPHPIRYGRRHKPICAGAAGDPFSCFQRAGGAPRGASVYKALYGQAIQRRDGAVTGRRLFGGSAGCRVPGAGMCAREYILEHTRTPNPAPLKIICTHGECSASRIAGRAWPVHVSTTKLFTLGLGYVRHHTGWRRA